MWRNWNHCALLVGMKNDAPSMEVPQKVKLEPPYDPAIVFLEIHPEEL